jgi:NAD(P)-dependent dehydrogenase (short-subunit alcohol dehydrogenase family)
LGEAFFEQLAASPEHRVVGLGRAFTESQRELAAKEPERILLFEVDFAAASPDLARPIRAATDGAEHASLILNAGMVEPVGAVGSLRPADVAQSVAVNLTAPMLAADAFVRMLPAGTPGTVLFTSSGSAVRPVEGWAAYCAAKAGGEMFLGCSRRSGPTCGWRT